MLFDSEFFMSFLHLFIESSLNYWQHCSCFLVIYLKLEFYKKVINEISHIASTNYGFYLLMCKNDCKQICCLFVNISPCLGCALVMQ